MEHLLWYSISRPKTFQVPFLPHKRYRYDGKGFDGFPERVGFDVRELWAREADSNLDNYDRLAFLQNWLYFAYADQVFGHIVPDNPHPLSPKYLVTKGDRNGTDNGYYIDSSQVVIAATAWLALNEFLSRDEKEVIMNKTIAILRQIQQIIDSILDAMDHNRVPYIDATVRQLETDRQDETDIATGHKLLISILLLAEQIDAAFSAIYGDPRLYSRMAQWPTSRKLLETYKSLTGCCLGELHFLTRGSATPNTLIMWQYNMRGLLPETGHKACTDQACRAGKERPLNPQHIKADCTCDVVRFSPEAERNLCSIVQHGRIPMLQAVRTTTCQGEEVRLGVVEFSPKSNDLVCVAISHVWADGLGNATENSMPTCQLLRLQELSHEVSGRVNGRSNQSTLRCGFWIDTMCIPQSETLKKQAIMQMADVYRDTSAVLILDATISQVNTDIGTLTTMWQIYTSPWYRRLWTLQEGVLNERTFVLLSDDMPSLEWFVHSYDNCETLEKPLGEYRQFIKAHIYPERVSVSTEWSAQLLDPVYRHLRFDILETRRTISVTPDLRVSRILNQLSWRYASVSDDETICLAILASYPMTPDFLDRDRASQLAAVIEHLGPCPCVIMFYGGPRLPLHGYRWIPSTFLSRKFDGLKYWETQPSLIGQPTPRGLQVRLPGIVEKNKSIVMRVAAGPGAAFFTDQLLHLTIDGDEFMVTSLDGPKELYSTFFLGKFGGIVLLHWTGPDFSKFRSSRALVGSIEKIDEEMTYVRPVVACVVRRRSTVYGLQEWFPDFGWGADRDERMPTLDGGAMWAPSYKSEAEVLEPRLYCVG